MTSLNRKIKISGQLHVQSLQTERTRKVVVLGGKEMEECGVFILKMGQLTG